MRNRKFHNLKFRRQVPVGRFIADFLCTKPKLIIEIDGLVHDFKIKEDTERTEAIAQDFNIPIIRFKNEEIIENMTDVLRNIEEHLRLIP